MASGSTPLQIGGYRILGKLGEGGMGAVFRAEHPRFPGRPFALKVLLDEKPDAEALERFRREVEALTLATAHPNIVRVLGGQATGAERPFIVMELVQGKPLDALAPLEPKRAAKILRETADAIEFVHGHKITHRDLKPGNILVEASDRPRVCDFGLAKLAGEKRLTQSGALLGTPAYAAPEQIEGQGHHADARTDVYGLGAVLWHALVGEAPFKGASGPSLYKSVLLEMPDAPSARVPAVPRELDAICWKCLAKEPEDRYPSAAALRDDLDRFLKGEPIEARTPTSGERFRWWARRHKSELRVGLVLVIVAAIASAVIVSLKVQAASNAIAIDEARGRALVPGATVVSIQEQLARLKALRASADVLALVERALAERTLAEKLESAERSGKVRPLLALVPEAVAAGVAPGRFGELLLATAARLVASTDPGIASDDQVTANRLVGTVGERRTALDDAAKLLVGTAALASARLAAVPGDGSSLALRARAALAERGLPFHALGPGRLDAKAPPSVLADLEAAARAGVEGAAALRADLLILDPETKDEEAKRAVALVPEGERALLARVLEGGSDPPRFLAEETAKLAGPAARDAAIVLSRFFARQGAPHAIEAPELAGKIDLAALKAVANRDATSFSYVDHWDTELKDEERLLIKTVAEAIYEYRAPDGLFGISEGELASKMAEVRAARLAKAEPPLAQELVKWGLATRLVSVGAQPLRGLSAAPFAIVWNIESGDAANRLLDMFDRDRRANSRMGAQRSYYYEDEWETKSAGLAAARELDERFARVLETDPCARAASRFPLFQKAARIAPAHFRLEQLGREETPAADRPLLVLEAFQKLETALEIPGPGVLVPRARLRRLAFPGELGDNLALLDLLRLYRASANDAVGQRNVSEAVLMAAALAIDPDERKPLRDELARDLWQFGVVRAREEAVSDRDPEHLRSSIDNHRQNLGGFRWVQARLDAIAPEKVRNAGFAPTPDDERRARSSPYVFKHPLAPRR